MNETREQKAERLKAEREARALAAAWKEYLLSLSGDEARQQAKMLGSR